MTTDGTPPSIDPVHRAEPTVETISFPASDGIELVGDLAVVDHPISAAIVCHPHPRYGGNRFNSIVGALFEALPRAGVTTLRFDFRADFGGGVAEQLDAAGALDVLAGSTDGRPMFAVGYSFGAMVALSLADERLAGKALIAPPLGVIDSRPGAPCRTLVMTPAHDQFAPPAVAAPIVASWPDATFEVIDSVDHFIAGRASQVADRVTTWIVRESYVAPGAT
jgi:alpha/beta superfamily hydrolase